MQTKTEYSPGSILVWAFAKNEAKAATYNEIVPAHFFLALCGVCTVPLSTIYDDGRPVLVPHVAAMQEQVGRVRRMWWALGIDTAAVCDELRTLLGRPERSPVNRKWHRSDELKRLCRHAQELAEREGISSAEPIHLLRALAGYTAGEWWPLLERYGNMTREEAMRRLAEGA